MREESKTKKQTMENGRKIPQVDPSATDNFIGFFALLLKIDKRVNPHLYVCPTKEAND